MAVLKSKSKQTKYTCVLTETKLKKVHVRFEDFMVNKCINIFLGNQLH